MLKDKFMINIAQINFEKGCAIIFIVTAPTLIY